MRVVIVHYDDSLSPGGINTNIRETFVGLLDMGVEVHIIQPNSKVENEIKNHPNFHEIENPTFPPPFNISPQFIRSMKKIISQIGPDIVHVHSHMNLLSHSIIRELSKILPSASIVFSPHLDVAISSRVARPFFSIFNRTFGRSSLNKVDALIFNSQFEKDTYGEIVGKSNIPEILIPPGIPYIGKSVERTWNSELTILSYGHFVKRKRVDRVISLFRTLLDLPDLGDVVLRLIICGGGAEEKNLRRQSRSLGVSKEIEWVSFLDRGQLVKKIQNSNYTILLSDSEAYGISVAESLSLGTPVICSNIAALSEYSSTPGAILFDDPEDFGNISRIIASHRRKKLPIGPMGHNIISNHRSTQLHFDLYSSLND